MAECNIPPIKDELNCSDMVNQRYSLLIPKDATWDGNDLVWGKGLHRLSFSLVNEELKNSITNKLDQMEDSHLELRIINQS